LYGCKAINLKNIPKNKIGMGSLITVQNIKTGEINNYKLIMSELSDKVSEEFSEITLQSPLGKALLNKVIHDEVEIQLFKNKIFYKILNFVTIHDL
jgi:transcription elongation GreA/GreB family factor